MEKQLFDLKFTAKSFEKLAAKSTKQEREELAKVKKALEKGNMDIARIHGQVRHACTLLLNACELHGMNRGGAFSRLLLLALWAHSSGSRPHTHGCGSECDLAARRRVSRDSLGLTLAPHTR